MVVSSVSEDLAQSIELVRRKFTKRLSDVEGEPDLRFARFQFPPLLGSVP